MARVQVVAEHPHVDTKEPNRVQVTSTNVVSKEVRCLYSAVYLKVASETLTELNILVCGKKFFEEAISSPVPVDMRALKALKRSPMALDIYCWLTYRMSYLRKPTEIPWAALQMQFGADYASDEQGLRNFKKKFLHHLRAVHVLYPEANVEEGENGLLLKPSKPHVAQLPPALPRLKNPPPPEPLLLPLPIYKGNTGPHLRSSTYEMARQAAPGWDVYELERQWREWIDKKGTPKKPDAAFIAFCRKKAARSNP